jgi:hypothetical protein
MYVRSIFIVFFVLVLQAFSVKLIAQNITGFSPASVCSGSSTIIQVDGSGFLNTVGVKIGLNSVSYNIVNDSQIQILNFNGASTGRIVVETNTIALTSPNDLIVKDLNSSLSASVTGTICESTAITYTVAGGSFYEFFVNGVSQGSVSPNNSITFIPSSGDNIFAKAFDSSMNCSQNTNVITAQLQPISKPQLISTTSNISVCNNDPISSSIIYQLTAGANDAFITGLPTGVTAEISGNNVIITGTPNISNAQDYNYVITPVGVPCHESAYGTISVALDAQLNLDLSSGNTIQVLCEERPLEPIIFNISGGATSASVTGLPRGVSATYDSTAKVLIIEGTPSDNVSQEQKYNYTVTTSGSSCTEQVLNGSITVNPLAQLTLLPTSGSLGQILCEGEAIEPILIALEGGDEITNVSGLPDGVEYSFNSVTKTLTVSGTPSANISADENSLISFAAATSCNTTYLTGNIFRTPQPTLRLISHLQTQNQLVCGKTLLEEIQYQLIDGATTVDVTGLPPGVTWIKNGNYIEISGIPDDVVYETNFEYSIFTEGNGCYSTLNFSIIVTPNTMDKPEAESVQSFCIYDAPKIKDIVVYANNLKWYSADGLSILDPETPLVDGETYYAHNEIIVSESSSIDRYACRSYPTTIQVFVQDTPPPQILEPSNRFCLDGQYTLTDIKVNFEDVVWYSTYTSDLPLSLETPLESMTYYAASIDPTTGCESMLRTEFEVYVEPCTVKVYNALSVNGDGLNEKLMIDNISFFPANEIVIYNRNGRVVYKTSGYGVNNNFFRGYSNISSAGNSKVLPMGTYYYTFTYARPLDGKIITTNGFINLVTN